MRAWIQSVHKKLDRPTRSAATRIIRGMIVLGLCLFGAIMAAFCLNHVLDALSSSSAQIVQVCLLALILDGGRSIAIISGLNACKNSPLPLAASQSLSVLSGVNIQALDQFGARRLLIEAVAEFASLRIFAVVWFFLFTGWIGLLPWIVLRMVMQTSLTLTPHYYGFFWSWFQLWRVLRAISTLPLLLCVPVAACFIATLHPWRAFLALFSRENRHAVGFLASPRLLQVVGKACAISLGGPSMVGSKSLVRLWLSENDSAQVEQAQARRAIMLVLLATVIAALGISFFVITIG